MAVLLVMMMAVWWERCLEYKLVLLSALVMVARLVAVLVQKEVAAKDKGWAEKWAFLSVDVMADN